MNQRMAVVIGVVRHAVNRSAGYRGFIGSTSLALHAANTIVGPSIVKLWPLKESNGDGVRFC